VPLAPHAIHTDLGISASMHCSATVPFFIIHEYYRRSLPRGWCASSGRSDKEGYASLPQGPGLGVEIDEMVLADLARKPHPPEWPTRGRHRDGAIADY